MIACQPQTKTPEADTTTLAAEQTGPAYVDLSVAEFKAKMAAGNVIVLDVRTPAEIAQGKIEGAIELDFRGNNFSDGLDKLEKEATYLVYCKIGRRSSNTCKMMSEKGFKKLYNLEGGYTAWSKENQ